MFFGLFRNAAFSRLSAEAGRALHGGDGELARWPPLLKLLPDTAWLHLLYPATISPAHAHEQRKKFQSAGSGYKQFVTCTGIFTYYGYN
jgi:hypothetical protein